MKHRLVFGGVLGLVVVLVATLAVLAPPNRLPGHAVAADPAAAADDALGQLADLRDIHLVGTIGADNGQELDVDIVVLADGAQAVVRDDAGGVAEFVTRDDEAAVRANAAWWRNTVPAFVQEFSGTWVKADDTAGFPVQDLRELSGDRLAQRLADGRRDWSATPVLFGAGEPAMALSSGDWTVFVSPTSPPRLLGIGGPVLDQPDRLARGAQPSVGYPTGLLATTTPDGPCRGRVGKPLDGGTAPKIADLPQPQVQPIDQRPQIQAQVQAPGGVCYTPMCPFTVQVVNTGNGAGVGMLMVTSTSGPPLTVPLNLPPGGQFSTGYNVPNPAPPSPNGRVTVQILVTAYAQITSLAGPDVAAGQRLNERGIDPNNPLPANPGAVGPDVTRFLDQTTRGVPVSGVARQPDGDQVIDDVKDMLGNALSTRLFNTLLELVTAPALRYGDDVTRSPLPDLLEQAATGTEAEQLQARRTLDLLKRLTVGRPPPATPAQAPIHVEDGIVYDDANKIAYRPAVLTKGNPGQRLVTALSDAVADFGQANVPKGFATVVELSVDGRSSLVNLSRSQFRDELRKAKWQNKGVKDVVLDGSGTPRVTSVLVLSTGSAQPDKGGTNGVFQFDVHDLAALGQTPVQNPPATPPPSVTPHFTPYSREHTLGGDPYDTNSRQDAGGHRHGTGSPGKTEFPKTWTDEQVEHAVLTLVDRAVTNANNGTTYPPGTANATSISAPKTNKNQMRVPVVSWTIRGTVDGVEMEVTMLQDGTLMAYPTGNIADKSGNLVPSPNDPTRADLPYLNPGGPGSPVKPPEKVPPATLPKPGGSATQNEQAPVRQTGRTVWVRPATPGGQGQWRTPVIAQPSSGPAVNVTVTTDQNGRKPRTEQPRQAPPPAPAVC
jgi:hypothetical protein